MERLFGLVSSTGTAGVVFTNNPGRFLLTDATRFVNGRGLEVARDQRAELQLVLAVGTGADAHDGHRDVTGAAAHHHAPALDLPQREHDSCRMTRPEVPKESRFGPAQTFALWRILSFRLDAPGVFDQNRQRIHGARIVHLPRHSF